MSALLFRLGKEKYFENNEEAKNFFREDGVLLKENEGYFYDTKKRPSLKKNEKIYFTYNNYLVAEATFTGETRENFERDEKLKYGYKLTNIQIIDSDYKLDSVILSTMTTYLDTEKKINEVNRGKSYLKSENLYSLEELFKSWLINNSKPPRYSKTIKTISKDLIKENYLTYNLYEITSIIKIQKIKNDYFGIDEFFEKNKRGNNMYSSAFDRYIEFLNEFKDEFELNDMEDVIRRKIPVDTETRNLIKGRIGQRIFREGLVNYWEKCSVTGFDKLEILIASHIKPWKDSTDEERLDLYNGLLLTPNLDKLFDKGFISFSDSGNILISSELLEYESIGLKKEMRIKKIDQEHKKYLNFHRENVFRK